MSAEEKFKVALDLRKENRLKESNELFVELAQLNPQNAYLHYQCAWSFDVLGEETKAVPYYEKAIQGDLEESDLENAYLGLGSTFRTIGEYEKSKAVLEEGIKRFPNNHALQVFYSMTLYNLNEHQESMNILLNTIANTTSDLNIQKYNRAIQFYADKLDQTWE
ncbi:MAG: tetratricopeptide repeat protein [Solibacillus sp.]|jgi:tetratricopeptide (TPR) repeat protein|uniref:tetratricopeptide repeat protein n=1 Tax=Solibacillus sp. TaxID=1909654 RepID=UPI0033160411